ncbi:hypothetical protein AB0K09_02205 [Streptomyces sp. NPDC049577]|uniref:hypothetical protein n=1 Tax=Streptomyces sp. NPDC049577 TaxID=3155153 RepID=UPI00343A183A
MIRTEFYVEDEFRVPSFAGPSELKVLGGWITSDIQLSPLAILEAIDLVSAARANPAVGSEELDGNAHTATITGHGVTVENIYVDHVRGEFTLDQALRVLIDFWDYCCQAHSDEVDEYRRQYASENGRDPLAGIRDFCS